MTPSLEQEVKAEVTDAINYLQRTGYPATVDWNTWRIQEIAARARHGLLPKPTQPAA